MTYKQELEQEITEWTKVLENLSKHANGQGNVHLIKIGLQADRNIKHIKKLLSKPNKRK